jgi:hypothetical protein
MAVLLLFATWKAVEELVEVAMVSPAVFRVSLVAPAWRVVALEPVCPVPPIVIEPLVVELPIA